MKYILIVLCLMLVGCEGKEEPYQGDGIKRYGVTWKKGVQPITYNDNTERLVIVGVAEGHAISHDSVGWSDGRMSSGYVQGKTKALIYDKKTGELLREYGKEKKGEENK